MTAMVGRRWTTEDFEELSWHDCSVHGLSIVGGDDESGAGELVLDLDFIVEWVRVGAEQLRFWVAPATLTFHGVHELKIAIDYAGAAMTPFSLGHIGRDGVVQPDGVSFQQWRLEVCWPFNSSITFVGSGFTQVLRREPLLVDGQRLTVAQRTRSAEQPR